jgi:quercetin dioxygenase-like cupin family protein
MTMVNITRGSVASYALVAAAAAAFSALITSQGAVLAQPAAGGVQQILAQPLPDIPGREVRISVIERTPGFASPPHRHPGHHTFGYVLEGTYEFAIDRGQPRVFKAGDTFYEPPGVVHSTSRNASADQRLKLLVFMVADQKNPSTVPE